MTLPAAAALSAAGLIVVALGVLWLTGRPKGGPWYLWHIEEMAWKDRLTYAAAVATGVGALVALVVAYRKQRDAEEGKFAAQFAAAAAQLGEDAPAVRIAGAYAIAALADRHTARRQQCIDVLTGYLRLPYESQDGHRVGRTVQHTGDVDGQQATITDTTAYRPADREVRLTIIRIIRDHLRDPNAPTAWCGLDLDFMGVTFDGGDFVGATFSGGWVSFVGATFRDGGVAFGGASFSGARVSFAGVVFSQTLVAFFGATFSDGEVSFRQAVFGNGSKVSFFGATFSGGEVSFREAGFGDGSKVSFDGARFSGGEVSFDGARFSGGEVIRDGRPFFGWTKATGFLADPSAKRGEVEAEPLDVPGSAS